jgi:membrane-bound serine protease (ClpP class)
VTALFGFSVLPTNWAGFVLILLGIALLVIDVHVVTHGALSVSGIVALAVGMLLLFHDAPSQYRTSVWFVLTVTVALGSFMAFAIGKSAQARRMPVVQPTMIGQEGVARPGGLVYVHGELWQAATADGSPLEAGDHVHVDAVDGLRLTVHRV